MVRFLACALASLGLSFTANAALDIGDSALTFIAHAALRETVYSFSLAESLKKVHAS